MKFFELITFSYSFGKQSAVRLVRFQTLQLFTDVFSKC